MIFATIGSTYLHFILYRPTFLLLQIKIKEPLVVAVLDINPEEYNLASLRIII